MEPLRLLGLLAILTTAPCAQQESQIFELQESGTATGLNAANQPSKIAVRVATRIASFTPPASSTFATHAQSLITAGVNANVGIGMFLNPGPIFWTVRSAGGQPIQNGCVYGHDDTGLHSARIAVRSFVPGDKKHGVGFAKPFPGVFSGSATGNMAMVISGHDTTSLTFTRTVNVTIPAQSTAAQITLAIRLQLSILGFSPNDVILANPFSTTSTQTFAGFGVDRFRPLFPPANHKVDTIAITYDAAIAPLFPMVFSAGWFPSGGFTEYGTGRSEITGFEPWIRGEGSYAPGTSYDVIADLGRPYQQSLLLLGAGRAGYVLPGAVYVLVDLAGPTVTLPGLTDVNGELRTKIAVPSDAGLLGLALFHQAFGVSPSQAIESSTGLFCRIWQ